MDVSTPQLSKGLWTTLLLAILALALALRLEGIGSPIMDHPGWRQGDTASIARNFAQLRYNVLYPQTTYNGPPPNYVELELQIVPIVAATIDKLTGVHVVTGRAVTLAFSLATVALLGFFGRWLFSSALAGLLAAFFYAVFPGSVYYGRTFMPDCAMVFFLTAALFATAKYLLEDEHLCWKGLLSPAILLATAYLAKPVAALALLPVAGLVRERATAVKPIVWWLVAILLAAPLLLLALYDRRVASYAEWHWASGITRLHVLPALRTALSSTGGFAAKCEQFRIVAGMFRDTMLGGFGFGLAVLAFVALPWIPMRSRTLLWTWLAAGVVYVFIVVTVERVDYYMYPLLPLCALAIGGVFARAARAIAGADVAVTVRYVLLGLLAAIALLQIPAARNAVATYYAYDARAYNGAVDLDRTLAPGSLVVIGHYGPDLQYYINRFGWEEDPLLWTPLDEESAIRKGARYFISVEDGRLHHNVELCAWLQRFASTRSPAGWPIYETSPQTLLPHADRFWKAFRGAERAGHARAFLDAHGVCGTRAV